MLSTSLPPIPSVFLKTPFLICTLNPSINHQDLNYTAAVGGATCSGRQSRKWVLLSSNDQKVVVHASDSGLPAVLDSGSSVVRKFYQGINGHDLSSVEDLIAENCVYEDLIFPQPFVGRKAILEFFKMFTESISRDLQFVIDDISEDDLSCVGVTWHLEWKGKLFPFSRGVSFYRLEMFDGHRQIWFDPINFGFREDATDIQNLICSYGRDSVEPAFKPGESALVAIRGVIWALRQFPGLADLL